MTAAASSQQFKALARELAGESIVTKALARFLEQIFEEVHAQEIKPLLQKIASLQTELDEANRRTGALPNGERAT